MSILYAILLAAVGAIVVAEAFAVVRRLSSPPDWSRLKVERHPALVPVQVEDRRSQSLPYVGRDRRASSEAHSQPARRRA